MSKKHYYFIPHLAESFNEFQKRKNQGINSKKKVKDAIKNFAKIAFKDIPEFKNPIEIEWTPVLSKPKSHSRKKRGYDVLNYSHQYKYSEDMLTELKKIKDDGNKFVKRHKLNTPIFIKENEQRGIIVIITELSESEVERIETEKLKSFDMIKNQLMTVDEVDQLFAINFFKGEEK